MGRGPKAPHIQESQIAEAQPSAGSWCGESSQGTLDAEMRRGGLVCHVRRGGLPAAAEGPPRGPRPRQQALSPEHGCKPAKQHLERMKPLHWREDATGRPHRRRARSPHTVMLVWSTVLHAVPVNRPCETWCRAVSGAPWPRGSNPLFQCGEQRGLFNAPRRQHSSLKEADVREPSQGLLQHFPLLLPPDAFQQLAGRGDKSILSLGK